jgi:protein-S-isoprenylcysteine O-methyltransferase Ste14
MSSQTVADPPLPALAGVRAAVLAGALAAVLAATCQLALLAPFAWLGGGTGDGRMIALLLLAATFAAAEAAVQRQRRLIERPEPAAVATALLLLAILATSLAIPSAPRWSAVAWIGVPVVVLGMTLRATAIHHLGGAFAARVSTAPDRDLVTTGPYALVRHPSELGTLALGAGAALLAASPVAAVLWLLALVPLVWWRVRREDEELTAAFGDSFERHRSTVPALAPSTASWLRGVRGLIPNGHRAIEPSGSASPRAMLNP